MKLSICVLTINRFDISSEIILDSKIKSGIRDEHKEILIADNGSTDKRIIEFCKRIPPSYHRLNSANEGVSRAFNQLMLRAKGEYIALIGNDILLQRNWAIDAIEYLERIPNSGIAAIHCVEQLPPITEKGVHESIGVFGTWVFKKTLLDEIGFFHEGYFPYGLEDSDFALRSHYSGHINFYIPNQTGIHVGHDVDEKSEYREMKNKSLSDNVSLYGERKQLIESGNLPIEPTPILKDPI